MRPLTDAQATKLVALVTEQLQIAPMSAPHRGEPEPAFTGRVLAPIVRGFLGNVDFKGLHLTGDGASSIRTVECLGFPFRPDLAVSYFDRHVLAIEVKYIRGSQRQNSVATALGQGLIYHSHGFENVLVVAIDHQATITAKQVAEANESMWKTERTRIVVRRKHGATLIQPV